MHRETMAMDFNARTTSMVRKTAGFTLLELMIVVAIVAILAAAAIASYDFAVIKARRAAATGCAMEVAQGLERHYTANLSYSTPAPPAATALAPCVTEQQTFYGINYGGLTNTTFTVTATPTARQDDTKCGTLTVNQVGARTASGTGTVDDCW
jgi:type IV pilus assembly protein PilE